MSFANIILLAGGSLICVPIVLHLLMRQQPKRILFPAVRFIKQREQANRRRLRFRHWMLLAARCAAILLLALALARPSIPPELVDRFVASSVVGGLALVALLGVLAAYWFQARRWVLIASGTAALVFVATGAALAMSWLGGREESGASGGGNAPVAAALVFDTSPRLAYKHDNRERIAVAQELGQWLITQFPAESEIAVLNSRSDSSAFAIDRGAAKKKIESLRTTAVAYALPQIVSEAIERVKESQLEQREVYVFTDLAQVSWPAEATKQLASRLADAADVRLYLVDVGAEKPVNFTLGDLGRFEESLASGGTLALRVDVASIGGGGTRSVEIHEYAPEKEGGATKLDDRPTRVRARREVVVQDGQPQQIELAVSGFGEGTTQGFVQLAGQDGLAADDRRFFTVTVAPAKQVLIASPKPKRDYALFLAEALSPAGDVSHQRYRCDMVDLDQLSAMKLEDVQRYAAVWVLDPTPATNKLWTLLSDYARLGGGVGVFLGRNAGGTVRAPVEKFNEAAQGFLPAPLVRIRTRTSPPFQLVTDRTSDAILARLADYVVPWSAYPVYKFWEIGELPRGVRVVSAYDAGYPAIVDQPLGKGRVVWMTTSISDPASELGHWNLLPTADPPWPFLALVDGMASHLTGGGLERYNYMVGQRAVLEVEPKWTNVVVTTPLGDELTLRTDLKSQKLTFEGTEWPGSYRALSGGTSDRWERGFSANMPAAETNLARTEPDKLREALGRPKLQIARNQDEIIRDVSRGRVGVKLFPWVMVALAAMMAGEFVLATLFYRPRTAREAAGRLRAA